MTHPVRGIKGSDLLGFDSAAVKNRIKGKNTAIHVSFICQGHYIVLAIDSAVVWNTTSTSVPIKTRANCGRDSPWILGISIYEGVEL